LNPLKEQSMFVRKIRSGAVVLAAMVAASAAAGAPKVRVLLLSGRNNHNWRTTTPALVKLYQASGRFAVTVTNEPEKLDAAAFRTCDAIVSNWTPWPNINRRVWDAGTEKAFLDFIRSGGGMVVFHAASTACQSWPEFQQIIGATWGKGKTGHGRRHEFAVKVADAAHPVTAGMGEFRIFDELWHRMAAQPKAKVLATAFSAKDRGGTGADEPVAFCTRFGQGRGFNLVLGHDTKAMSSPGWQALMLRGTEWAATGKVTLPPPAALVELSRPRHLALDAKATIMTAKPRYTWSRTETSLALMNHGRVVWRYRHKTDETGKPCFDPLALPDGSALTWHRPPDHPWHRAAWFCWKYINGLNYWEENRKTGRSPGRTVVKSVRIAPPKGRDARIELSLAYHPPGKPDVLTEKRIVTVTAPAKDGSYRVDWQGTFTAGKTDAVLRGGEHGGGYAGFSARLAKATRNWKVLNSEGLRDLATHGKKARWVAWSGELAPGKPAGIAIFDHPGNLRHPSPWYVAARANIPFNYFSPALLFSEPYTLKAGESMTLRYRLLVHPGRTDAKAMETEWKAFSRTK
jgi:type 1 glutamine amidotransferase